MPRRTTVMILAIAVSLAIFLAPGRGRATTFTQVTSDTTSETDPSPSPDGKWIAFTSDRCGRGATQIYIMPADGGEARQLTQEADSVRAGTPTWAPDGKSLIFVSTRSKRHNLYSIPFEGGEVKPMSRMPGSNRFGVYSRDGKYIAFYSNRLEPGELFGFNIYVMSAGGETEEDLARQVTNVKGSPGHPTWSADGKWIAFVAKEYDEKKQNTMEGNILFSKYHLYKVPSGGGTPVQLSSGAVEDTWPAWSPDGKWIAFGRQTGTKRDVWLLDVATSKAFPLTTTGKCIKPNWSYDGKSIYYTSVNEQYYDLWVARDLTLKPPATAKKSTRTKPRPKTASTRTAAPPATGK